MSSSSRARTFVRVSGRPVSAFVVGEAEAGERLDQVVAAYCGVSRGQIKRWIESDRVLRNGKPARSSQRVAVGDRIEADPPEPEISSVAPEAIPLVVLHEDDALIVIDKPAGLVVHPAPGHSTGTLVNALLHHCRDLAGIGGVLRPGIVHRLDQGTSGVMVAAKTDAAHLSLATQFHDHTIGRLYRAFVRGVPGADGGRIARPIGRHPRDRKRMSVVTRSGRSAQTNWHVEARWPASGISRLALRPETGRTHQLRVHLSSEGMPIVGDPVYGRSRRSTLKLSAARALTRPALHAATLGFVHPVTGEVHEFESPLPPDLVALESAAEAKG